MPLYSPNFPYHNQIVTVPGCDTDRWDGHKWVSGAGGSVGEVGGGTTLPGRVERPPSVHEDRDLGRERRGEARAPRIFGARGRSGHRRAVAGVRRPSRIAPRRKLSASDMELRGALDRLARMLERIEKLSRADERLRHLDEVDRPGLMH
jgi:hypothetical protein